VQEATWAAETVLEGARTGAAARLRKKSARLAARLEELRNVDQTARGLLEEWRQPVPEGTPGRAGGGAGGGSRKMTALIAEAGEYLQALRGLSLPRLLRRGRVVTVAALLWLALIAPMAWLLGWLLSGEVGDGLLAFLGATAAAGVAGVSALAG